VAGPSLLVDSRWNFRFGCATWSLKTSSLRAFWGMLEQPEADNAGLEQPFARRAPWVKT